MEKNIVQIRRPSGEIEEVALTGLFTYVVTACEVAKLATATRNAGRGEILGFVSGGIKKLEIDSGAASRSRRTYAAILGGSLDEHDDTSYRALRGGY